MTNHPHAALLKEFQFAIKHFVPTLPKAVKEEAQALHDQLAKDPKCTEEQIEDVFYQVGIKEYPYRHAYVELTKGESGAHLNALVLEHVDPVVRKYMQPHLDAGVTLDELVRSELFESQLSPEQRYQVEDGILVASSKLTDMLKGKVGHESKTYEALVAKWTQHAKKIEESINELETLAPLADETQSKEILGKVEQYREGFLVTEPDPVLEEVKKEVEYWKEQIAEAS